MSFCVLIVNFFLTPNNVSLYAYNIVCLFINPVKDILVASSLGGLQIE